jgi:hypothetical protein
MPAASWWPGWADPRRRSRRMRRARRRAPRSRRVTRPNPAAIGRRPPRSPTTDRIWSILSRPSKPPRRRRIAPWMGRRRLRPALHRILLRLHPALPRIPRLRPALHRILLRLRPALPRIPLLSRPGSASEPCSSSPAPFRSRPFLPSLLRRSRPKNHRPSSSSSRLRPLDRNQWNRWTLRYRRNRSLQPDRRSPLNRIGREAALPRRAALLRRRCHGRRSPRASPPRPPHPLLRSSSRM